MSLDEDRNFIESFILYGNRKSFNNIVGKYKKTIFNLCFNMLYNFEDAEDCAQEVFVKVFKNLKGFKFKSNFSTWLYRIAINTCKNKLNSIEYRLKKKQFAGKKDDPPGNDDFLHIADNTLDILNKIEIDEENVLIREAIEKLPVIKKTLIILRDIESKSYEEISVITRLKIGTVKSKLSRAREDLKRYLKGILE